MTAEELQIKRDALLAQIANANQRLQSGDQSIEKRDMNQLQKALAIIDAELAKLAATSTSPIGRFYTGEGL
jgi:hypothetical protein